MFWLNKNRVVFFCMYSNFVFFFSFVHILFSLKLFENRTVYKKYSNRDVEYVELNGFKQGKQR